jgi:hypothetical protein
MHTSKILDIRAVMFWHDGFGVAMFVALHSSDLAFDTRVAAPHPVDRREGIAPESRIS